MRKLIAVALLGRPAERQAEAAALTRKLHASWPLISGWTARS